jgi:hypothetical protein
MIICNNGHDLLSPSVASHDAADYRDKEKESYETCNRYANYVPSHALRSKNILLDPDVLVSGHCILEFERAQEAVISGSNEQCGSRASIYSYQRASSELVTHGHCEILSACPPKDGNHYILGILDENLYFGSGFEGVFLNVQFIVARLVVFET